MRKGKPHDDRSAAASRRRQAGKDDVRNMAGEHPFDGARVSNILPGIADELGLERRTASSSCRCGQARRRPGWASSAGDVIVSVGRKAISTVRELEEAVGERQRIWQVVVKRGKQVLQLQVRDDVVAAMSNLFEAAGLEKSAPRPLGRPAAAARSWRRSSVRITSSGQTAR